MTPQPQCCGLDTNLAAAVEMLWSNDCGVLPVVENGKLAGIITDRDICIALGTRLKLANQMTVREVATPKLHTCAAEDDVQAAMEIMRRARVRRLPVIDEEGRVAGVLALHDLVLAVDRTHSAITYEAVINTLKALSEPTARKPAAVAMYGKSTDKPRAVSARGASGTE
jgi:CBS-domain-containing membrane protein